MERGVRDNEAVAKQHAIRDSAPDESAVHISEQDPNAVSEKARDEPALSPSGSPGAASANQRYSPDAQLSEQRHSVPSSDLEKAEGVQEIILVELDENDKENPKVRAHPRSASN